eukprot:3932955-Rhodomonas_salina.4
MLCGTEMRTWGRSLRCCSGAGGYRALSAYTQPGTGSAYSAMRCCMVLGVWRYALCVVLAERMDLCTEESTGRAYSAMQSTVLAV